MTRSRGSGSEGESRPADPSPDGPHSTMKLTDPRENSPPLLHLLSHTRPYIANDLKLDYKLDYKLDKNKRDALLAALALLPLYGPAVYLLLRPQLPNDDDRVT